MKTFFKKEQFIFLTVILQFLPTVALAQIVQCTDDCGFDDLIILIDKVINFLLFNLSIPLSAILFAYAGFMLMTAGGNESKISGAKQIFGGVLWGLLIAFGAWIIVHTILTALGLDSDYSFLN